MTDLLWLIIALPLAGATINLLFGRRLGEPISGWLGLGFVGLAWAIAVPATLSLVAAAEQPETIYLFSWIPAVGADIAILWDPMSALMTMIVTGIGSLIHLYSIGYMRGDERYPRFFAFLNLFIASMMIASSSSPISSPALIFKVNILPDSGAIISFVIYSDFIYPAT